MATTQQITGALRKAGKIAYQNIKGKPIRHGYQVAQWKKGLVGVLTGNHETREEFRRIVKESGFETFLVDGIATDGFFVK